MIRLIVLLFIGGIISSCVDDTVAVPKPRIYPRIEFPVQKYQDTTYAACDVHFSKPLHTVIRAKSNEVNDPGGCYFDLEYPDLNGAIYCSYFPIESNQEFERFINDSYEIVNQINKRSEYMQESSLKTDQNYGGILFDFSGPAASPVQFFISDSTSFFFKGAVYLNTEINPDSLAPVNAFIRSDVVKLINSFQPSH